MIDSFSPPPPSARLLTRPFTMAALLLADFVYFHHVEIVTASFNEENLSER